jgi:dTDP-4-amino-4,6-dideoxygalactose transaminase
MTRIYLSPPDVGPDERALLLEALESGWIAPLGPFVDRFEADTSSMLGGAHTVALSSGTAALHLALILAGIGPDDEVFVPTLTFSASANAVTYVGARPTFVDVDPTTWQLDPRLLADELDRRSKAGKLPAAVITVDLYGQCADYHQIVASCRRHGVHIIEDAAEALGATYDDQPAGTFGEYGVLSFNGNKVITTSGGGMLITHDPKSAERARWLATQARDPAPHYEHSVIGFNYRMSNLLAAVGVAQLRSLNDKIARRRSNNEYYRQRLEALPGVGFMPAAAYGEPTWWLTCVTFAPEQCGVTSERVRLALAARGIEARPVWKPMHMQPVFRECTSIAGHVAEQLFATGLCLPSGSTLTDGDRAEVADVVVDVVEVG